MKRTDEILQEYRKVKKLKHEDIAKNLKISRTHLINIFTGKRKAKGNTLEEIMDFLEVSNEDRSLIYEYEEFTTASEGFQMRYFSLEKENEALKKKLDKHERLEKLDKILDEFYRG